MADIRNPVEAHYTSGDLGAAILAALQAIGKDIEHLTLDDLAAVERREIGRHRREGVGLVLHHGDDRAHPRSSSVSTAELPP